MVQLTDIGSYALALLVAAAVPGPGITALVARSATQGTLSGAAMTMGLIVGDLVYLTLAVFGLTLLANHFSIVFLIVRIFSVTYLVYLAWQFWHSAPQMMRTEPITRKNLVSAAFSGLAITLSNPKPIAFYLALMPLVLDLNEVTVGIWAGVLVPVTICVLALVGGVYVIGANALRYWLTQTHAQRWLNRGASVAMLGAAGSLFFKVNE